jgi:hypothetical protein
MKTPPIINIAIAPMAAPLMNILDLSVNNLNTDMVTIHITTAITAAYDCVSDIPISDDV